MFFSSRRFILLVCTFALIACKKSASSPVVQPRYAVLRFENLSGEPALDWTGRALSETLPVALAGAMDGPVFPSSALSRTASLLGGRPAVAPGISTERANALLNGANRLITGYVERVSGKVRITAVVEDSARLKTLRTITAQDTSPMAAMSLLAHELSPRASALVTSNPEALRSYTTALESSAAASVGLLQDAVRLDPAFGPAWIALVNINAARNDRAGVESTIDLASRQNLDALSRSRLDLEAANLHNDKAASIAAMRRVVALSPADTLLLRTLAEAETTAGDFEAATADYKKIAAAFPEDILAWNSLGYVRSYAGDYAGALAALQQYDRLRPKDANPQDSIGDLNYSFGKFKEAAASYLSAYGRQHDFEQGGDLYKAAWAKFQAGDKQGADALFTQFRDARKPEGQKTDLIAGDWLYRTGRTREAFALLRKLAAETQSAPLRVDSWAQIAVWDLLEGDRNQASKDAASIGNSIGSPPVFIARFASLPSAPAAEWEARAQKMLPPNLTALRQLALGYALVLDGKREAALPAWEQIVRNSPANDYFVRAVYTRLQGKPLARPLLPEPNKVNQFAGLLSRL